MKKQLLVSFLARKSMMKKNGMAPIYCRVRYDDTTTQFSTKIDVPYINWDSKRTRVIGNSKKAMNLQLETIRIEIIEKYEELTKANVVVTSKNIVDYYKNEMVIMNSIVNVFIEHNKNMKSLIGKEYSYGSFKNYKTTLKHLRSYIKETYSKKDVLLSKVDYHFISHFSLYILKETECNNNGMMKHMQRLKKIINFSLKNNYITNDPFTGFKISFKRTNRVYLTKEELLTISQVTLNESLSKVRDVFLFSCYTGLSYVDLYNLKKENIKSGNDGLEWIYIKRSKTNIPSNLPLLPPAFSLLKKYREIEKKNRENKENAREKIERNRENRVFPMISNQKTNKALKEISLLCNFNKKLTFHSARHTFATTVTLTNGVPIETVSKMLGHNNIRTTQIYARVLDSKISSDMLILRQKFI